jgi:hypothetical protein
MNTKKIFLILLLLLEKNFSFSARIFLEAGSSLLSTIKKYPKLIGGGICLLPTFLLIKKERKNYQPIRSSLENLRNEEKYEGLISFINGQKRNGKLLELEEKLILALPKMNDANISEIKSRKKVHLLRLLFDLIKEENKFLIKDFLLKCEKNKEDREKKVMFEALDVEEETQSKMLELLKQEDAPEENFFLEKKEGGTFEIVKDNEVVLEKLICLLDTTAKDNYKRGVEVSTRIKNTFSLMVTREFCELAVFVALATMLCVKGCKFIMPKFKDFWIFLNTCDEELAKQSVSK